MARLSLMELNEKKNWTWNSTNLTTLIKNYCEEQQAQAEVKAMKPMHSGFLTRVANKKITEQ